MLKKISMISLFVFMFAFPLDTFSDDILFNGDFEYALGGWSYGSWWGGEYEFSVVEEPYTGEYSIKIECIEIGREAKSMLNTTFTTEAGVEYTLSFWHKGSKAGAKGRVYINDAENAILDFSPDTDWQQTTLTFTALSEKPSLSLYHIGEAGTSIYFDHILINVGSRAVDVPPGETSYQGIPSKVTVGEYVTFYNGCPIFPVSAYNAGSPEDAKEAGFNCLIDLFSSTDFAILDKAFDLGLPVIGGGMTGLLRAHFPEKAGAYAEIYKNHPAIFAHYMIDEPDHDWWYVPPGEIVIASESIHAADPFHPTMMLQMRWSIGATFNGANYYNYSESSDIFAVDPYVFNEGSPVRLLGTSMSRIRTYKGYIGKPVWFAIEGGWDDGRVLTREEQYGVAWTSIANNVNGLFFFEYEFLKKHPDQLDAALDITSEIRHLEGALTSPVSTMPKRVDGVDWYSRKSPGGLVIFAANTTDEAKTGIAIAHPEITSDANITDIFDRRNVSFGEGVITDDFAPYERHVYIIDAAPHFCLLYPGDGMTDMHPDTRIKVMAIDDKDGIDESSIVLAVNGKAVSPEITTDRFGGVQIVYSSPAKLSASVVVSVTAKNKTGKDIATQWSFSVDTLTGVEEDDNDESSTPDNKIRMNWNYPNPFNPRTTIEYQIAQPYHVTLSIYNAAGQRVDTLINGFQRSGSYRADWDASDMPSGIYFSRIHAGQLSKTRKMLLLK